MTVKIDGTNTVANPAFTGADTDTGLQVGTNELKLVTGGTARATINSSGQLGIGTESPQGEMHLHAGDSNGFLRMTNTTTGATSADGALFQMNGNDLNINNLESGNFIFHTADTERMRILSGGGLTFNGDTAQTNALDDYEEGTWSPGVVIGTCTASDAKYIKIGKLVKVNATITGFSDRTTATILQINNVPYASSQVAQASGSMFGRYLDRTAYTSYVKTNGGVIEFYSIGSGNFAPLQHQHLNNGSSLIYLQASWIIN